MLPTDDVLDIEVNIPHFELTYSEPAQRALSGGIISIPIHYVWLD